jgi:hypothetical protein
LATFEDKIGQADFYSGEKAVIEATLKEVSSTQEELDRAYKRWEQLEG